MTHPHPDCDLAARLEEQSRRHHDALTRITEVTTRIQASQDTILAHLVGTFERPGLVHRVAAIETRARVAWWSERGTKAIDSLILALVVGALVLILKMGFQAAIRDIIRDSQSDLSMAVRALQAGRVADAQ